MWEEVQGLGFRDYGLGFRGHILLQGVVLVGGGGTEGLCRHFQKSASTYLLGNVNSMESKLNPKP
jgi:hypothetical protein